MTDLQHARGSDVRLHGSLVSNLEAAVDSALRHRGKLLYPDTLQHWGGLTRYAEKVLRTKIDTDSAAVRRLTDKLIAELARRPEE
jgi:hypothetical protein